MKKRNFTPIIVSAVLIPLAGILMIGIYGLHSYTARTPVLTPAENVTVRTDSEIGINELCSISNAVSARIVGAEVTAGNIETVMISADGQTLSAEGGTGRMTVTVSATGSNAESRDIQVNVTVTE
ncbi:hypothetical protein [uncultured Ruminococcus sp.]|uniref:hypothetical protein n=1 Tax=uncultured Ruminococcus sp. TaxID=165186 RepID=UPI0025E857CA|nr:hypothetical protein [uncultured Ruminococcus sp.]